MPMSAALREVIASLPRIKNGPYLFSTSAGKRPLAMTGPIKADLDKRMLRTLVPGCSGRLSRLLGSAARSCCRCR